MNATDPLKNIPESEKTPLVIALLEINQKNPENHRFHTDSN